MASSSSESSPASDSEESQQTKAGSNSDYAMQNIGEGILAPEIWLLDRRALSIRMKQHPTFPSLKIIESYEEYTSFDRLPELDASKLNISDFFSPAPGFASFIHKFQEEIRPAEPGQNHPDILEAEIWKHVAPHLRLAHYLSTTARRKLNERKAHKVMEADSRAEWDTLTTALLRLEMDSSRQWSITSGNERQVQLSRNPLADYIHQIDPPIENNLRSWLKVTDFFEAYRNLCADESEYFSKDPHHTAHSEAFLNALNYRVSKYYKVPSPQRLLNSAYGSPSKAKVDNLAMMSIPVNLLHEDVRSCIGITKYVNEEDRRRLDMDDNFLLCVKPFKPHSDSARTKGKEDKRKGATNTEHLSVPSIPSSKVKEEPLAPKYPHPHHVVRDPKPGAYSIQLTTKAGHASKQKQKVGRSVQLAYIIHEYKRPLAPDSPDILQTFGISEFPLFGIAVDGYMALVTCAWSGKLGQDNCIYVGDRDTVQYNLADPFSAYNYCTFLSKLVLLHGPKLARLLQGLDGDALMIFSETNMWTRTDQTNEFDNHPAQVISGTPVVQKQTGVPHVEVKSAPTQHHSRGSGEPGLESTPIPQVSLTGPKQSRETRTKLESNSSQQQPAQREIHSANRSHVGRRDIKKRQTDV